MALDPTSHIVKNETLEAVIGTLPLRGMSGIWYLRSTEDRNTLVSGNSAILTGGGCRNGVDKSEKLDDRTVVLSREATERTNFLEHENRYELVDPHYIDLTYTLTARKGFDPNRQIEEGWCCYTNNVDDVGIHFLENGRFSYFINPVHGQQALFFPSDQAEDNRFPLPETDPFKLFDGKRNFLYSDSGHTFDQPFYFGSVRGMMFQVMLDTYLGSRFYISPQGGGPSPVPGKHNPAWDLMWVPGPYKVDESKTLQVRLAITKPHAGGTMAHTAIAEFEKFRQTYPTRDLP